VPARRRVDQQRLDNSVVRAGQDITGFAQGRDFAGTYSAAGCFADNVNVRIEFVELLAYLLKGTARLPAWKIISLDLAPLGLAVARAGPETTSAQTSMAFSILLI